MTGVTTISSVPGIAADHIRQFYAILWHARIKERSMIKTFVQQFLKMNPEPSDAQVHSLADALGIDHQTLESVIYQMLSQCMECVTGRCVAHLRVEAGARLLAVSEFEQVLMDELEPEEIRDELTTVNDGEEHRDSIDDFQELTEFDGGILPDQVQFLTKDDGVIL